MTNDEFSPEAWQQVRRVQKLYPWLEEEHIFALMWESAYLLNSSLSGHSDALMCGAFARDIGLLRWEGHT